MCAYMTKHAWQNKASLVAATPTSTAAAASSSVAAATAPRAASGAGPAKKTKRGKKKKQAQSGVWISVLVGLCPDFPSVFPPPTISLSAA